MSDKYKGRGLPDPTIVSTVPEERVSPVVRFEPGEEPIGAPKPAPEPSPEPVEHIEGVVPWKGVEPETPEALAAAEAYVPPKAVIEEAPPKPLPIKREILPSELEKPPPVEEEVTPLEPVIPLPPWRLPTGATDIVKDAKGNVTSYKLGGKVNYTPYNPMWYELGFKTEDQYRQNKHSIPMSSEIGQDTPIGKIILVPRAQAIALSQLTGEAQFKAYQGAGLIPYGSKFLPGKEGYRDPDWSYIPVGTIKRMRGQSLVDRMASLIEPGVSFYKQLQKDFEKRHIKLADDKWIAIAEFNKLPNKYKTIGLRRGFDSLLSQITADIKEFKAAHIQLPDGWLPLDFWNKLTGAQQTIGLRQGAKALESHLATLEAKYTKAKTDLNKAGFYLGEEDGKDSYDVRGALDKGMDKQLTTIFGKETVDKFKAAAVPATIVIPGDLYDNIRQAVWDTFTVTYPKVRDKVWDALTTKQPEVGETVLSALREGYSDVRDAIWQALTTKHPDIGAEVVRKVFQDYPTVRDTVWQVLTAKHPDIGAVVLGTVAQRYPAIRDTVWEKITKEYPRTARKIVGEVARLYPQVREGVWERITHKYPTAIDVPPEVYEGIKDSVWDVITKHYPKMREEAWATASRLYPMATDAMWEAISERYPALRKEIWDSALSKYPELRDMTWDVLSRSPELYTRGRDTIWEAMTTKHPEVGSMVLGAIMEKYPQLTETIWGIVKRYPAVRETVWKRLATQYPDIGAQVMSLSGGVYDKARDAVWQYLSTKHEPPPDIRIPLPPAVVPYLTADVVKDLGIGMIPILGTLYHWEHMKPWMKGLSVALDVAILIPVVGGVALGVRAGKSVWASMGRVALAEVKAPVTMVTHPIGTAKAMVAPFRVLAHPKMIPLAAAELRDYILKVPIKGLGKADDVKGARDILAELAIRGEKPVIQIGGKEVEMATVALQQKIAPAAVHTSYDLRPFLGGVKVQEGAEGLGLFVAPTMTTRLTPASAFGAGLTPAPIVGTLEWTGRHITKIGRYLPQDIAKLDLPALRSLNLADATDIPADIAPLLTAYIRKGKGTIVGSFAEWLKLPKASRPHDIDLNFLNPVKARKDMLAIARRAGYEAEIKESALLIRSKTTGQWLEVCNIKGAREAFFKQHLLRMMPAEEIGGVKVIPLGEQYLRQGFGALGAGTDKATFTKRAAHMLKAAPALRTLIRKAGFTEKMPGALIIRDERVLAQLQPSGKLWRGTAEIEKVVKAGTVLPPPSQIIRTVDEMGDILYLAIIGKPLSIAELTKLKITGALDVVRGIFKKPIRIDKVGVEMMDDANDLVVAARALESRIAMAQKAGRTAEVATLRRQLTSINARARAIGKRIDLRVAGATNLRIIGLSTGEFVGRLSYREQARAVPVRFARLLRDMPAKVRGKVIRDLTPRQQVRVRAMVERLPRIKRPAEPERVSPRVARERELARAPRVPEPTRVARADRVPRMPEPSRIARITRVPREPVPPRITRVPRMPRVPRKRPTHLPIKMVMARARDEARRKAIPAGSIAFAFGERRGTRGIRVPQWYYIPPPYTMRKPISLSAPPIGAVRIDSTKPKETIQRIGESDAPVPESISVDIGVTDAFITEGGKNIGFTGEGEQTNVGQRVPSPTTGMSIPAISRVEIAKQGKPPRTSREVKRQGFSRPEVMRAVEEDELGEFIDETEEFWQRFESQSGNKELNRHRMRRKPPRRRGSGDESPTSMRGISGKS